MASKCVNLMISKCRTFLILYMIVIITIWVTLSLVITTVPEEVHDSPEKVNGLPEKVNGLKEVVRDVWTEVNGLNQTYVYNAHFTGRDRYVRIVGVGPTASKPNVQCRFLCLADITTKEIVVSGKLVQMLDAHGLRHNNIEILCRLPTDCFSDVVSVTGPGTISSIYLKIYFPPLTNVPTSLFTVCFPAIHSNFSLFTELVQSFEMDSLLGAKRFTLYYNSATPEVDAVLRMYVDSGRLLLFQWNLPKLDVHYFAQVTSVRDCFYRNMHTSKFLVFKDFDEVLLPYNHDNWNSLLGELLQQDPKYAVFIFKNSFLYKQDPDVSEGMNSNLFDAARAFRLTILLKQHRQTKIWPGKLRSKFIVNPEGVDNVEIHMVRAVREGYKTVVINETDALMYHYKKFVDRKIPRERDSTMLRFKSKLIKRVDKVYMDLNRNYTVWQPLFT